MKLIGVDIGGSHISAASLTFAGGQLGLTDFQESSLDTTISADALISAWSAVIQASANGTKDYMVGIAMPGPYNYPDGISLIQDQGKMKSLFRLSVKELLAESLGIAATQIQFTNDAEAFLLGESLAGSGKTFQNSIGITLGTGLGSAIKSGKLVTDAKLWTAPFRDGIAEDYLGTAWFRTYSYEQFGMEIKGVKDLVHPEFDRAIADQIFFVFGNALGEFLLRYIQESKADGVILGGKIALVSDRFLPHTHNYLKKSDLDIPILISELGEKSALIGAIHPFLSYSI